MTTIVRPKCRLSIGRRPRPCDSTGGCARRRSCGWPARARATARVDADSSTGMLWFFSSIQFDDVSSYRSDAELSMERERCRPWRDRFVFRKKTTLSAIRVFDPPWCAHLLGNEFKLDCLSRPLISSPMPMIDLTRDHTEVLPSQTCVLFHRSVFPLLLDAALRRQAIFFVG